MAKSDVLVRMKADTQGYDANIAKARRTLEGFKQDNLSLGGILNQTTKSLASMAAGFLSVSVAAEIFCELIFKPPCWISLLASLFDETSFISSIKSKIFLPYLK